MKYTYRIEHNPGFLYYLLMEARAEHTLTVVQFPRDKALVDTPRSTVLNFRDGI
jgi:hypothetical protein